MFWRGGRKGHIFYWGWEVIERDGNEKKGVQSSTPIGYLKKTGGYGFRAVIGRM